MLILIVITVAHAIIMITANHVNQDLATHRMIHILMGTIIVATVHTGNQLFQVNKNV